MKQTVQVLMSTYNGEKYIKEQIDSILNQEDVNVEILIRDDGSMDKTMEILRTYEKNYQNITVYTGANLGPCKSFFDLMFHANNQVSYYAFADQDDVWKKDKIKRAISMIQEKEQEQLPVLYCSLYELVDSNLKEMGTNSTSEKQPSFGNSLIECIYNGCTGVFNKKLLELSLKQMPQYAYMHDWWLYMVATAMGRVICDNYPSMLYRQHENNVLGGKRGHFNQLKRRINNFKKLCTYVPQQVEDFFRIYQAALSEEQTKLIKCVTNKNKNPLRRLEIFKRKEIRRNNVIDNLVYKWMFLFWMI